MNRCLTEGRKAFLKRVAGVEAGGECERLAPVLSALADGEASAQQLATLRPHLRSCLTCRSRLREFRCAGAGGGALPPIALAAGPGRLRALCESLLGAAQHKAAALGERAHTAAELATGQKVAAVAATAAAMAGGGTGVKEIAATDHTTPKPRHSRAHAARVATPSPGPNPTPPATTPEPPAQPTRAQPRAQPAARTQATATGPRRGVLPRRESLGGADAAADSERRLRRERVRRVRSVADLRCHGWYHRQRRGPAVVAGRDRLWRS